MDASDWIALAALVVALVSGGAAVCYARRAADYAGDAVAEARRSADEAGEMRALEEGRRREEKQRWHTEREPRLPSSLDAEYRDSPGGGPGYGALWGVITVPHAYRVRAFAVVGDSWSPIALDMDPKPGQPVEFMIERWHPDKEHVETDEIRFRFWPPIDGPLRPAAWSCDCGNPSDEGPEKAGHWERSMQVTYQRPWAVYT